MKNKKMIAIIALICIILVVGLTIYFQSNSEPEEVEILNSEYNYLISEYEEQYSISKEKVEIKKGHLYTLEINAGLTSGSLKIHLEDPSGTSIWEKKIDNKDYSGEAFHFEDLPEGICTFYIQIYNDTEGSLQMLMKQKRR